MGSIQQINLRPARDSRQPTQPSQKQHFTDLWSNIAKPCVFYRLRGKDILSKCVPSPLVTICRSRAILCTTSIILQRCPPVLDHSHAPETWSGSKYRHLLSGTFLRVAYCPDAQVHGERVWLDEVFLSLKVFLTQDRNSSYQLVVKQWSFWPVSSVTTKQIVCKYSCQWPAASRYLITISNHSHRAAAARDTHSETVFPSNNGKREPQLFKLGS